MKKATIVVCALLLSVLSVFSAEREPMDVVVALDTSAGLYSSYGQISEYLVGPLLVEYLKPGDTFHLVAFSEKARSEISRRVAGREDIETIISRLLITYPLDPYTDLVAAIEELYAYLRTLPPSRPKTVLLLSDGEQSPPPGSPNAGLSAQEAERLIAAGTAKIKAAGWDFRFIKIPLSEELLSAARRRAAQTAQRVPSEKGAPAVSAGAAIGGGGSSSAVSAPAVSSAAPGMGRVADGTATRPSSAQPGSGAAAQPTAVGPGPQVPTPQAASDRRRADGQNALERASDGPMPEPAPASGDGGIAGVPAHTDKGAADAADTVSPAPPPAENHPATPPPPGEFSPAIPTAAASAVAAVKEAVGAAYAAVVAFVSERLPPLLPYLAIGLAVLVSVAVLLFLGVYMKRSHSAPSRLAAGAAKADKTRRTAPPPRISAAADPAQEVARSSASSVPVPVAARPAALPVQSVQPVRMGGDQPGPALRTGLARKPELLPVRRNLVVKKADARIMLSLWVRDQNRSIGKRNVHLMKAGTTLTLGGGRSDFLVFLVAVPQRIADIHYDGATCTLLPRRAGYFPDAGSDPIEDCQGKTVRVLSDKGFELFIRLEEFEDPLLKLNSFLRSIDTEGMRS